MPRATKQAQSSTREVQAAAESENASAEVFVEYELPSAYDASPELPELSREQMIMLVSKAAEKLELKVESAKKPRKPRVYTPEQKEKMLENLRKAREKGTAVKKAKAAQRKDLLEEVKYPELARKEKKMERVLEALEAKIGSLSDPVPVPVAKPQAAAEPKVPQPKPEPQPKAASAQPKPAPPPSLAPKLERTLSAKDVLKEMRAQDLQKKLGLNRG
jgi:hypothetical protein